jgi:L-alanine-DL-glutamate epimerase-like enolase superfamily enzyme
MKMKIADAKVTQLEAPVTAQVKTSFGVMNARHGVLLVLEEEGGHRGVGESWVNFPVWTAWERKATLERGIIPRLKGHTVEDIGAFIKELGAGLRGPYLQAAAMGPYLQTLCAVELALWDLAARMQGLPLARLFCKEPASSIRIYGSGINSPIPWPIIDELMAAGVTLFKLKLGFGQDTDTWNLEEMRRRLGTNCRIAVDVNRGWKIDQALKWLDVLREFNVQWLEEPLCVQDEHLMGTLRDAKKVPIAGGENLLIDPCVTGSLGAAAQWPVDILQPDLTKNCGLSDAVALLPMIEGQGRTLIPHILGSAPGQAASLHLAAACRDPLCEWDINPNPLRTALFAGGFTIRGGRIELPQTPGLGWELDEEAVQRFRVV